MARKRKKGEQEIRILPDGRVVFLAPDEALLEIAQRMVPEIPDEQITKTGNDHDGKQDTSGQSRRTENGAASPAAE